jgi:site-specific recombinase XerD
MAKKLLDQPREVLRLKHYRHYHDLANIPACSNIKLPVPTTFGGIKQIVIMSYSYRTEEVYLDWVRRFILFHKSITVRDGQGEKDRIVPLAETVIPDLRRQMERVRLLHEEDLATGGGEVYLPNALEKKYPHAARELIWQYLLPALRRSLDPGSGKERRHHLDPSGLQRAVKQAAQKAGLQKRVTCHTLRHSFASHLLQGGYDIRTVQELLGYKDVRTTMVYTHVLPRGGLVVRSPLD